MDEVVKAMANYGIHRDADTLRRWGLNESSTGFEIRKIALEYKDYLKR